MVSRQKEAVISYHLLSYHGLIISCLLDPLLIFGTVLNYQLLNTTSGLAVAISVPHRSKDPLEALFLVNPLNTKKLAA